MLENITQSALSLFSCQLAWLLVYSDEILVTGAITTEPQQIENAFLQHLAAFYPDGIFPTRLGDNPLAEVLLRNTPLLGLPVSKLDTIAGSAPFRQALMNFNLPFVTLVPLRRQDRLMGVLVLGLTSNEYICSEHGQQVVKLLRRQAVLELDNLHLSERLVTSNTQRQDEHAFYQLVLDTLGDGLLMTDMQGIIKYVSQRLLAMTGYSQPELLGAPVGMLFSEAGRLAMDVIRDKVARLTLTQELRMKSGKILPVLMSRVITQGLVATDENIAVITLSDLSELRAHEQVLERQTRRLQALNRASQAISSPLGLQEVIQVILTSVQGVVQAEAISLLLRDTEKDLVVVAALGSGGSQIQGRQVPVGAGVAGWVAQHVEPLLLEDAPGDERYQPELDSIADLEIRSLAAVPLVAYNQVIGVLVVMNRVSGAFDSADLEILENLGTSAAIAIENATLFEQTHRRLTELSTLLDASAVVAASVDLNATLEHISRRLREALDVQRVVVATIDRRTRHTVKLVEVVDASWSTQHAPLLPLIEFYSKRTALLQAQATIAGLADLPTADVTELYIRGMKSTLNVPLRFRHQIVGLVSLYSKETLTVAQAAAIEKIVLGWQETVQHPWEDLTVLCHRALQAANLHWCAVYRWDDQQEALQLLREMGVASWQSKDGPVHELDEFPTMQKVVESGTVRALATTRLRDFSEQTYFKQLGAANCLIVPVSIQSQVLGVVQMMTVEEHEFDDSTLSLAQGIANIIGNALENSTLYSSLENRAQALEAAYREIEQADRLKDELLQNLSHELGTPLTHILGYLSLLEEGAFGEVTHEQQSALQLAVKKTQRVAELIRHMVAVHASNAYKLNVKETHLDQLAALAIRTMTPKARAANIRIVTRIPPTLPSVQVDQVTMSEVFEALLDNAIKFSHGGGKLVEVSIVDPGGPTLQVSVRDEGIGIAKAEHEKIFREFYQVDGSITRKYGGMGLGLSVVQKVIGAHGGKVWIESDTGQGTCIYFTVPKAGLDGVPSASDNNNNVLAF